MLIKIVNHWHPRSSEITDPALYRERRRFLRLTAGTLAAAALPESLLAAAPAHGRKLADVKQGPFSTTEPATPYQDVTRYNNFYEFSTEKEGPATLAHTLRPHPWSVTVEGEVGRPGSYALEDLVRPDALEERIYRLRCVEGWSMVIPWIGFPLRGLIGRVEPTSRAKFVEFTTLFDSEQMPGQRRSVLEWPYIEGLRIDEAMHPLTLLAVGLYGETLPNQNGAPLRLVVPWKYGFKSIKSIVKIRFQETQPMTAWMKASPREYGFYSNVNPQVDHPRWSQARERRIGDLFKRETLMFNGYSDLVADLYAGMDLKRFY